MGRPPTKKGERKESENREGSSSSEGTEPASHTHRPAELGERKQKQKKHKIRYTVATRTDKGLSPHSNSRGLLAIPTAWASFASFRNLTQKGGPEHSRIFSNSAWNSACLYC